jgi:hypothetical protein
LALQPDDDDTYYVPAEYRVRLFLSVDLSGSTAFKNSKEGEKIEQGATPKWVSVFQHFYSDFPARYRTNFQKLVSVAVGDDGCPEIWKAVGDELVFCGCVSNKKSVAVALTAFISTLHEYRIYLVDNEIDLNLKGASWIAAFPEPNRTVQLKVPTGQQPFISATEAIEASADSNPFDFDFLGKAIDSGFRIAGSATPERFVLCAQLARLIVSFGPDLGFGHAIRFDQPLLLKGVNRGEPYPTLYIDSMTHLPSEPLRKKERELLKCSEAPEPDKLAEYLKLYCQLVHTDEIMLKLDAHAGPPVVPASYSKHRIRMADHLKQEKGREFNGEEPQGTLAEGSNEPIVQEEDLNPLSDE